jgi:pilus assembly protein CpaC
MAQMKNKINAILVCILVASFICLGANAEISDYLNLSSQGQGIVVIIGETATLNVNNPKQVKIGNPTLLDVASAGKKELLLSGLEEGETVLTVVDDFGKRDYAVKIYKEDLAKLKERVDILLEASGFDTLQTRIGDREKKIFVIGSLPLSKQASFDSRLGPVKEKIVSLVDFYEDIPSVEIDVEVLEVEKTEMDTLGLSWNKSLTFSEGTTVPDRFRFDNLLNPAKTLKIMSDWRTETFDATLNFLKQNNKARTLSRPKLVCLSGKEAKLLVGGERPIIKSSSTTASTSGGSTTGYEVEYKDYGIDLTIKPIVKDNDKIQVALNTEITEVDTTQSQTVGGGVSTPGFKKRTAETELTVLDGQTVFMAGLIKNKNTDDRDSISGLGSIPIIGALFRNKDFENVDTEIVITLTTKILKNKTDKQEKTASIANLNIDKGINNVGPQPVSLAADDPAFDYSSLIQNIINSNIEYPQELKNQGAEGTVKLSLHLLPTGELLGAVIMQSSGNKPLDEAADRTVKKLAPFPAFPSELKLKELWLDIPIVYKAER